MMTTLPTPYYQDSAVTLYLGDCREILPLVRADAVVTDPPYGLNFKYESYEDTPERWFALMDATVPLMQNAAPFVVMPVCAQMRLGWWYAHHPPTWLIAWYKGSPGHSAAIGFNDWEAMLCWGKPPIPMHDYFQSKCGFAGGNGDGHPCPKPIEWANWLVARACPEGGTVLDPFAGSGTTLESAKWSGRKAIGIELEKRYCDIAVKRLRQETLLF